MNKPSARLLAEYMPKNKPADRPIVIFLTFPLALEQLFSHHRFSALRTSEFRTFDPSRMGSLVTALCTDAKASGSKRTAVVAPPSAALGIDSLSLAGT